MRPWQSGTNQCIMAKGKRWDAHFICNSCWILTHITVIHLNSFLKWNDTPITGRGRQILTVIMALMDHTILLKPNKNNINSSLGMLQLLFPTLVILTHLCLSLKELPLIISNRSRKCTENTQRQLLMWWSICSFLLLRLYGRAFGGINLQIS